MTLFSTFEFDLSRARKLVKLHRELERVPSSVLYLEEPYIAPNTLAQVTFLGDVCTPVCPCSCSS